MTVRVVTVASDLDLVMAIGAAETLRVVVESRAKGEMGDRGGGEQSQTRWAAVWIPSGPADIERLSDMDTLSSDGSSIGDMSGELNMTSSSFSGSAARSRPELSRDANCDARRAEIEVDMDRSGRVGASPTSVALDRE